MAGLCRGGDCVAAHLASAALDALVPCHGPAILRVRAAIDGNARQVQAPRPWRYLPSAALGSGERPFAHGRRALSFRCGMLGVAPFTLNEACHGLLSVALVWLDREPSSQP